MKLPHFLFCILLAFVAARPAFALNKTVSVTSTPGVLVTPGFKVRVIVIQNPTGSAGSILVSLDGTNPTYSSSTSYTGILVPSGQQLILCYSGQTAFPPPATIIARAASSTVAAAVSTDDTLSQ